MPITMMMNNKDRTEYRLYTRMEIEDAWDRFADLNKKDIAADKRFVICRADTKGEAHVLAAMIMRETELYASTTYYDSVIKKLYICCEYSKDIGDTVAGCARVIRTFLGMKNLDEVKRDWHGEPLFHIPAVDISNYPHSAVQQDYGGMGGIHARFPSDFAGVI